MAKKISMTQAVRKFADAMGSALNQTSIVTQCVSACAAHFQGETPTAKEVKEFADGVAEIRGWSESSIKARKSEVRNVVRHYSRMPTVVEAITNDKRCEGFTWHNAIKVARLCKDNKTTPAVVRAYFDTKPSKHLTPTKKINNAIKVLANTTTTSAKYKAFVDSVLKLADKQGINYE